MEATPARILIILQKDGMNDDSICIRPDSESNGYTVKFDQKTIENTTYTKLSNTELGPYLDRVFRAIQCDAVPYEHIQIDCPLYPTVLVTLANLYAYLPILLDQIQSIQSYWPQEWSGRENVRSNLKTNRYEDDARIYVILQKTSGVDDVLSIEKMYDSNSYWVRFEQKRLYICTEASIEGKDLLFYLQRFMNSLISDEEPYESIQFDCPTYPTTIVKKANLHSYFSLFAEQVYSIQNNWPYEVSGKKQQNPWGEYDWDVLA